MLAQGHIYHSQLHLWSAVKRVQCEQYLLVKDDINGGVPLFYLVIFLAFLGVIIVILLFFVNQGRFFNPFH